MKLHGGTPPHKLQLMSSAGGSSGHQDLSLSSQHQAARSPRDEVPALPPSVRDFWDVPRSPPQVAPVARAPALLQFPTHMPTGTPALPQDSVHSLSSRSPHIGVLGCHLGP